MHAVSGAQLGFCAIQPQLDQMLPIACRFFSSLVQRAAKVHRRRGGGSLTLLMVLPG